MPKAKTEQSETGGDDMLPEYDFAGQSGTRGKYYRAYQQGHTVEIKESNGAVSVQHFTLEDGAVWLEPDVRAFFPDSASVNKALRSLIALIPTTRLGDPAKSLRDRR